MIFSILLFFKLDMKIEELEENIRDAYHLMVEEESLPRIAVETKEYTNHVRPKRCARSIPGSRGGGITRPYTYTCLL